MMTMKLTWDEFKDEHGHYWVSIPYVIRAFGVGSDGQLTYRLEGPGVDIKHRDVELLKTQAELEADRTEFRKRLGV
jgi:hypothetical protein